MNRTDKVRRRSYGADGIRASERPAPSLANDQERLQLKPLAWYRNSVAKYDPDVNYSNVLAALLLWIETRDDKRAERRAQSES